MSSHKDIGDHESEWAKLSEEKKIEAFARFFQKINQYDRHHGMELVFTPTGYPFYRMKVQSCHLSSPGVAHGGSLAAMMDATLGLMALLNAVKEDKICSTVEFKINYLSPALLGETLIGESSIEYRGNSLVVVSGGLYQEDTKAIKAKGMGTFNLYPMTKKGDMYEHLIKELKQTTPG